MSPFGIRFFLYKVNCKRPTPIRVHLFVSYPYWNLICLNISFSFFFFFWLWPIFRPGYLFWLLKSEMGVPVGNVISLVYRRIQFFSPVNTFNAFMHLSYDFRQISNLKRFFFFSIVKYNFYRLSSISYK